MTDERTQVGEVAIQVLSHHNAFLLTSPEARQALMTDLQDVWAIRWMPPIGKSRFECGFSESITILLYFFGFAFWTVAKPFFEETAKEAGKDFWKSFKTLVSKVQNKSCGESYRIESTLYAIFELNDEFIAIEFSLGTRDDDSEETVDSEVDRQVAEFLSSLQRIRGTLAKFHVGVRTSGSQGASDAPKMHVIRKMQIHEESVWEVEPIDSAEFFDQIRPRPERRR